MKGGQEERERFTARIAHSRHMLKNGEKSTGMHFKHKPNSW